MYGLNSLHASLSVGATVIAANSLESQKVINSKSIKLIYIQYTHFIIYNIYDFFCYPKVLNTRKYLSYFEGIGNSRSRNYRYDFSAYLPHGTLLVPV